jgi:hypothetical protein
MGAERDAFLEVIIEGSLASFRAKVKNWGGFEATEKLKLNC